MRGIAIIGIRLIAIWALIKSIVHLQFLPQMMGSGQYDFNQDLFLMTVLPFLLHFIPALILAFKAPAISGFIIPESGTEPAITVNYEKLAAVLFSTAGILIFFWSISTFFNTINSISFNRSFRPGEMTAQGEIMMTLLGGGLQMLFGLALFAGGKKIATWWYNFRNWT